MLGPGMFWLRRVSAPSMKSCEEESVSVLIRVGRKRKDITYDDFAQRPSDDTTDVFFHVFGAVHQSLCFPLGEYRSFLASIVHFFDVVVHVLDQENVVV